MDQAEVTGLCHTCLGLLGTCVVPALRRWARAQRVGKAQGVRRRVQPAGSHDKDRPRARRPGQLLGLAEEPVFQRNFQNHPERMPALAGRARPTLPQEGRAAGSQGGRTVARGQLLGVLPLLSSQPVGPLFVLLNGCGEADGVARGAPTMAEGTQDIASHRDAAHRGVAERRFHSP